jgi:TM2 domain-containing membrane protein YozV
MFCPKCGKETPDNQAFCASCGAPLTQAATPGSPAAGAAGISPKSRLAATLLCAIPALFAIFGIHRIYIGKIGTGVTMIVLSVVGWITVWFFVGIFFWIAVGIWAIVDFAFIVAGRMKDSKGLLIEKW